MKKQSQTPSPRGIIAQRNKVNTFRELFLNNLDSPHVEIYRKAWAKARARLSEMQATIHFCRKEVCIDPSRESRYRILHPGHGKHLSSHSRHLPRHQLEHPDLSIH